MNLNIDGSKVDISWKSNISTPIRVLLANQLIEFLNKNEPFLIYEKENNGLIVIPSQQVTFDLSTGSLIKHEEKDQLEWVVSCAFVAFDKIRALTELDKKKLLDAIQKKKLEKPESKIILLN